MAEEESFEIKPLSTSSEISLNLQFVAKKTKRDESCENCQATANDLRVKTYGNWPSATYPFERIHLDFFTCREHNF
jgi:hypothetical protein